jgi:hypothetical protein
MRDENRLVCAEVLLMSSLLKFDPWTVRERTIELALVPDPAFAPYYRLEQRLRVTAECPRGHALPNVITASREVVRAMEGTEGVGFACKQCGINYALQLGSWPAEV